MAEELRSPDGRTWTVRRRWVPRLGDETTGGRLRRRLGKVRRRTGDAFDADPGCLDYLGESILAGFAILVAVLVILFLGLPLLVAVVDLALVLLLAGFGLVARVLLRRPWTVEARASDGTTLTWRVVGWRASGERVQELRQLLGAGIVPEPS